MKVKSVLLLFNALAVIAALIWLITDQSWESAITTLGVIGSLIALANSNKKGNTVKLEQKGGKNSTNYQSAGDINISIEEKND